MMYSLRKFMPVYILAAWMLSAFVFLGTAANAQSDAASGTNLQLYAQSAILMDAGSGRILYEKNGHEIRPMASTTKIMTCILALEYGNLEDYVEVSSHAASMPKVKLGMRQGECYQLKDLLYSLMLESHNDSAVAIAEHIGGSVSQFADMMNQKARDLGCEDTFFITPNGLDAVEQNGQGEKRAHSTTAADLARIMSYCIMESPRKEEFLAITRTASYQFSSFRREDGEISAGGRSFYCNNHNAFLGMMEGALSGKTGFTANAGYCYVGALQRGERTYVVALLACGWPNNKTYKWSDTRELMNYGLDHFEYHSLSDVKVDEESLEPIPVEKGQGGRIGGAVFAQVEIASGTGEGGPEGVLLSAEEEIEIRKEISGRLEAPVRAGEKVGEISYLVGGEVYGVDYVVTKDDIRAIDFGWCLTRILEGYMLEERKTDE